MSAVLRIALAAFSIVPLQRALNLIGAAITVPALVWELVHPAHAPIATFTMFMGILLIVLTPFFGGGAALRYASTKSLLHLRPHGRARMLLGAALAITLIAALVALPMFVLQWLQPSGARLPVPGGTLLPVMWLCTVLAWIGVFGFLGGPPALRPLLFLIPFAIGPIVRYVGTSSFGVMCFALVALAAFLAFPFWYALTDTVKRPGMGGDPAVGSFGSASWQGLQLESQPLPSRTGVLRHYLMGSATLATPLLSGFVMVLFMALVSAMPLFVGRPFRGMNPFLFLMLGILGMSAATQGHILARRARLLWLRAGQDRAALFALARREGLIFTAMIYAFPLVVVLGAAVYSQPERTGEHLAFVAAVLTSAICLLHAGLSTTRNWAFPDIALMTIMVVVQITMVALAHPGAENSIAWALGFTAGFAVLTAVLGAHARRRWLLLDWRVMRMLQTGR